ncbi:MAG: hypothetical protein C0621_06400, partial [Desulfuromonas sp.]
MAKIFISYRRSDAAGHAGRLYDRLKRKYGKKNVFFDLESIHAGEVFTERIEKAIHAAKVVLAVIGPDWLSPENKKRLHRDNDVVRMELALSTELSTTLKSPDVIPLVCGGAEVPSENQLPVNLRKLFTRHAPRIFDSEYEAGFNRLCNDLEKIYGVKPVAEPDRNLRDANPKFVGRTDELKKLSTAVDTGKVGVVAAVHGFGGMGKTELAVKFANDKAGHFVGGLWDLNAEGHKALLPLIGNLTLALEIQESASPTETGEQRGQRVLAELKKRADNGEGRALLLLDNISEPALLSNPQLNTLHHEAWLTLVVTTRLGEHDLSDDRLAFVSVDSLSPSDALNLILKHQPGGVWPTATAAEDEAAAQELVRELGGFTLAVEAVAVYLGLHPEIRPAAYLKRLIREGLISVDALGKDPDVKDQLQHRERQLALILDVTLERLTEIDREALAYAALLPPDSIPWLWLRDLLTRTHGEALLFEEGYPNPWVGICQRLEGARLLTPSDQDGVARLHRIVGAHLRVRNQGRSDQLRDALVGFMEVFGTYFEHTWEHDPRILWILKPLQEAISYLTQEGADERLAKQAGVVGEVEMRIGRFSSAFAFFNLSHQTFKQLRIEQPDSETLSRGESAVLNSLADFLAMRGQAGDAEQALAHYQQSLEV